MKKTITLTSIFITFIFFLCSCSPTIEYMGNKFQPTNYVELFFDSHDIKRDYKVMGIAKNDNFELDINDSESIQQAMIAKAKAVGADAILFEGYPENEETSRTTTTDYYQNTDVTTSEVNTMKIYKAKFIKYNH